MAAPSTNPSVNLLREQAKRLRGEADACESEASLLRAKADQQAAQAAEMTKRACDYEIAANSLCN